MLLWDDIEITKSVVGDIVAAYSVYGATLKFYVEVQNERRRD
jgi:hypothetical protein